MRIFLVLINIDVATFCCCFFSSYNYISKATNNNKKELLGYLPLAKDKYILAFKTYRVCVCWGMVVVVMHCC